MIDEKLKEQMERTLRFANMNFSAAQQAALVASTLNVMSVIDFTLLRPHLRTVNGVVFGDRTEFNEAKSYLARYGELAFKLKYGGSV